MTPGPATFTLAKPADTTAQWPGVDLAAITKQLTATGVYAPAEQTPGLEKVVARADGDGHDLHVVVLEQSFASFTVYRDIAAELQTQVGGTVIVLGPNGRGTASSEFTRVSLEDGATEAKGGSSPEVTVARIYDRAVDPHVDWTVVTLLLIVLVVIGAAVARFWTLRTRAAQAAAAEPGEPGPGEPAAAPADAVDGPAAGADDAR